MVKNLVSESKLIEVQKKVIPGPGDFIMYQGSLLRVVKIKHSRQFLIVESNSTEINLPLKVGYRIFMPVAKHRTLR